MKPSAYSKKKFLIIGLCYLLLLSGCDDNLSTDVGPRGDGKLKRVLMYADINAQEPISILEEYEYDSLDRISKVSFPLYENGEIVGAFAYDIYEYDTDNKLIKKSCYNANSNYQTGFIQLQEYTYLYGANGLVKKETISFPQIGSSNYFLYLYDRNRLKLKKKYNEMDELEFFVSYEYDMRGKLVKETTIGKDGNLFSYTEHFYTNGLNTESKVYGSKAKVLLREIYRTYNDSNNLFILESYEMVGYSSLASHVLKYEYD